VHSPRLFSNNFDYPAQLAEYSTSGIWMAAGYLIGMTLVRFLPRTGMPVAIGTIALIMARVLLLQEANTLSVLLGVVVPMLSGGLHAKSRNLHLQFITGNAIQR
jgi:hypothetical protein